MALSDEMKALVAELVPAVQVMVDNAVKAALPAGVGALAASVIDEGISAVEAHNPKYFPPAPASAVPGIAPVQPVNNGTPAAQIAVAMGNAPLAPTPAQIAPVSGLTLDQVEAQLLALASKVEALSAASGLQTSAAMAAHT